MKTLENLIEKGKQVKQVRQTLINALDEAERGLAQTLEDNGLNDQETLEKFDYKGFGLRYMGSKNGKFIRLTKLGTGSVIAYGYPPRKRGEEFHYSGDFNSKYRVMTRTETLELANKLKEFSDNMRSVLEELKNEEANAFSNGVNEGSANH